MCIDDEKETEEEKGTRIWCARESAKTTNTNDSPYFDSRNWRDLAEEEREPHTHREREREFEADKFAVFQV